MISIVAFPHIFGFGISFEVGLPVVNSVTLQEAHMWGFNILLGPLYLQVKYVG